MKTIHYLHASILCFICFFFLTIFIIQGNPLFFDAPVYSFFSQFSNLAFFRIITEFGGIILLSILLIISFFIFSKKKDWYFLLSMMLLELSSNITLKLFFGRPRPDYFRVIEETSFSFPSGHSMASTMFYGLMIYFLWQSSIHKNYKILWTIVLFLLILSILISRNCLGVHYSSDILGGVLCSLSLMFFGIFFYRTTDNKKA